MPIVRILFPSPYHRANKRGEFTFHEATFAQCDAQRAKETFHTTAMQAGEIARDADVKQLLIGHFPPVMKMKTFYCRKQGVYFPIHFLLKRT